MKYGLYYYKNTRNLGDDIWAYAQSRFYPKIDYLLDNTTIYTARKYNEDIATIIAAFVEPFNSEYSFLLPQNIIPFFIGSYFRPTMMEYLENKSIINMMKRFEPIGCRARSNVSFFSQNGIDAYFSGCISLTLPDFKVPKEKYICLVDVPDNVEKEVRGRVGDDYEIVCVTHSIDDIQAHSLLSIEERFELVEDKLRLYSGAHCVVTSRLHAALPCLTQNTPVLFVTSREKIIDVNDIDVRICDYYPLLHHCYFDQISEVDEFYDFNNPPQNSSAYLEFRENIIKKCRLFISDCEEGKLLDDIKEKSFSYENDVIDLLQNKIQQLKYRIKRLEEKEQKQDEIIQLLKKDN